jgi:hypothetical protein
MGSKRPGEAAFTIDVAGAASIGTFSSDLRKAIETVQDAAATRATPAATAPALKRRGRIASVVDTGPSPLRPSESSF